ncbi:MAG: cyclic lactone autoinducer peptide [Lachnospiraceae bacterium]|nr:cyclic lactone autoinducer peptide [Lachnospiraceae bacterium]
MRKTLLKLHRNIMRVIPALAFLIAASSITATCFYMSHQPDIPEGLMKFER